MNKINETNYVSIENQLFISILNRSCNKNEVIFESTSNLRSYTKNDIIDCLRNNNFDGIIYYENVIKEGIEAIKTKLNLCKADLNKNKFSDMSINNFIKLYKERIGNIEFNYIDESKYVLTLDFKINKQLNNYSQFKLISDYFNIENLIFDIKCTEDNLCITINKEDIIINY